MPDLVQCGWCPVIMIFDWPVIYLHFAEDHKIADGSYSLRHNIRGDDWDVAELTTASLPRRMEDFDGPVNVGRCTSCQGVTFGICRQCERHVCSVCIEAHACLPSTANCEKRQG